MSKKDSKDEFVEKIATWLKDFLEKKYPDYTVEVISRPGTLDKFENEKIKTVDDVGLLNFSPEILGILENKTTKKIELVLVESEIKAYGVKDIGKMLCWCKLAKPKIAIMTSKIGLSAHVHKMINHGGKDEILSFNEQKIKTFRWNVDKEEIDKLTITPREDIDFFD